MPSAEASWDPADVEGVLAGRLPPTDVIGVHMSGIDEAEPVVEVKTPMAAEAALAALMPTGKPFHIAVAAGEQSTDLRVAALDRVHAIINWHAMPGGSVRDIVVQENHGGGAIGVQLFGWPLSPAAHDVWRTGLDTLPTAGIAWRLSPQGFPPRKLPRLEKAGTPNSLGLLADPAPHPMTN